MLTPFTQCLDFLVRKLKEKSVHRHRQNCLKVQCLPSRLLCPCMSSTATSVKLLPNATPNKCSCLRVVSNQCMPRTDEWCLVSHPSFPCPLWDYSILLSTVVPLLCDPSVEQAPLLRYNTAQVWHKVSHFSINIPLMRGRPLEWPLQPGRKRGCVRGAHNCSSKHWRDSAWSRVFLTSCYLQTV